MKAFIFDTETTGLLRTGTKNLKDQPEVIEFYGCFYDLKRKKVISEFETLIQPEHFPMSEETIKETKTKLTNKMLEDAPRFSEVADEIRECIEKAPITIAHNLSFDRGMLDVEFARIEQELKWPKGLCTVEQTNHIKGYRLNLTNLHKHLFNDEFADAHRARSDVEALCRICVELFKRDML